MWGWRLIRDSRGKISWTHTLAIPIVILITGKLLAGGVSIQLGNTPFGPISITLASMAGQDYVAMISYWIGLFALRETTEKVVDYLNGRQKDATPDKPANPAPDPAAGELKDRNNGRTDNTTWPTGP